MKSQLSNENISFISTSQNVGYDFDDVPTLIHSWMNSDMHRSRMLNTKYENGWRSYERLLFTYFLGKIIYLWKGNHTLYTEETMSILDDIEGLSDMIVQSELYHDFRAAQEMLNNDDEAHLMYQAF